MLNRNNFIQLCKEAIINTRECMTPVNQVDGYITYQNERNNCFVNYLRYRTDALTGNTANVFYNTYMLLLRAKIGHCDELADFLLVELAFRLQKAGVTARLRKVKSATEDHVYVHVRVELENEHSSLWEIDAWDPRIIDISKAPDDSIKNAEHLEHGHTINLISAVWSDEIKHAPFIANIDEPIPGRPLENATPPHDITSKHPEIYSTYTVDMAFFSGKLPRHDKLSPLQACSPWQQKI